MTKEYFEIIGVALALLYLWLELRQKTIMWVVGFLSSLAYVIIFFQNKFYAEMCLNSYYVLMSIYGFYAWKFSSKEHKQLPTTHIRRKHILMLLPIVLLVFYGVYFLLHSYTDSPIPLGDAFVTAVSFAATWMVARKFLEHWIVWAVIDLISAGIFLYKGMPPTAGLYLVYGVVSVYGYFGWKKRMEMTVI